MHLLFWLSLLPFVTEWVGRTRFAPVPTAIYGIVLLMASLAYWLLQTAILKTPEQSPLLGAVLGNNLKGRLSPVLYVLAIACAFAAPRVAGLIYIAIALMWLVPDRRIEKAAAGDGRDAAMKKD